MKKSVLVIFKESLTLQEIKKLNALQGIETVIAATALKDVLGIAGSTWIPLEDLIEKENIYEAKAFVEELSHLKLRDGTRITKSFIYGGYELWWAYCNKFLLSFGLPYSKYKKLLAHVKSFHCVHVYEAPFRDLFSCYLDSYGCEMIVINGPGIKTPSWFSFGLFVQVILTFVSLPIAMLFRRRTLVFIGDKFDGQNDFDFRMKFIYEELRRRKVPFIEFIRSLESWKTVFTHAIIRKRPVIYSEAIITMGKVLSTIVGGSQVGRKHLYKQTINTHDQIAHFKYLIATQYLINAQDDIWAIRIMRSIIWSLGIKAAYFTSVQYRNFHAFLGCKSLGIPTVGIQHGASPKDYFISDFMSGFDGEKPLSVDRYGLWSEWWREYFIKNSKAYASEQLQISGFMRPFQKNDTSILNNRRLDHDMNPIKVLFVPGELSIPSEVIPYLRTLMGMDDMSVYLTFRPYRDGFENWLRKNDPQIIESIGSEKILLGNIHDAISQCDVCVGSYSTAVLEALLQLKPAMLFHTNKWGDCLDLKSFKSQYTFYAETPSELITGIRKNIHAPREIIQALQNRYFGEPGKNGSAWVVDQLEDILLQKRNIT